jgi:hypothetical protein
LQIHVNRPAVSGNRVDFHFSSSEPLKRVRGNSFFVEYPADISDLPVWVHYNAAVAYLLSEVGDTDRPCEVVLADPFPAPLAAFWRLYHDARQAVVAPLAGWDSLPEFRPPGGGGSTYGVLFGGGKDSLFTLTLLSQLVSKEQIRLISFTSNGDRSKVKDVGARRDELSLDKVRAHFGVGVERVVTDVMSVFTHLHMEIYTAALLPLLGGLDIVTFSLEYAHYFNRRPDGSVFFSFRRSRPELAGLLSSAYGAAIGRPFRLLSANYFVSELSSLKFLAATLQGRLPDLLMMCEATYDRGTKWCGSCTKCATFVLYGLHLGIVQDELPPNRFLRKSPWLEKVLERNADRVAKGEWFPELTPRFHFDSFRHVLAGLRPLRRFGLSRHAKRNLRRLRRPYARMDLAAEEAFYGDALDATWPPADAARIRERLAGVLEEMPAPVTKSIGNERMTFDKDVLVDVAFDGSGPIAGGGPGHGASPPEAAGDVAPHPAHNGSR